MQRGECWRLWGLKVMAKQINCGICAYHGNTVAMTLIKDHFECPECGAQTYDNDAGDDCFVRNYKQQQKEYVSRSFQPGTHVVGGGDAVGKSKTEAMKKKSVGALRHSLDEPRYY